MPNTKANGPDGLPTASEFGQLRAWLARQGVKQADIAAAIGNNVKGRSHRQIAAELCAWCRTLPKRSG